MAKLRKLEGLGSGETHQSQIPIAWFSREGVVLPFLASIHFSLSRLCRSGYGYPFKAGLPGRKRSKKQLPEFGLQREKQKKGPAFPPPPPPRFGLPPRLRAGGPGEDFEGGGAHRGEAPGFQGPVRFAVSRGWPGSFRLGEFSWHSGLKYLGSSLMPCLGMCK